MNRSGPVDISTSFAKVTMLLENAAGIASEGQDPFLPPSQSGVLVAEITAMLVEVCEQLKVIHEQPS